MNSYVEFKSINEMERFLVGARTIAEGDPKIWAIDNSRAFDHAQTSVF